MNCPVCKADNDQKRRYCRKCGARLFSTSPDSGTCPVCNFSNQPDDKYCGGCSAPLDPSAAENRNLNVVAWQTIRQTIGQCDSLVITLLIQATILLFVALGIIIGTDTRFTPNLTAILTTGLAVGMVLFFIGVNLYTGFLESAVKSAKTIEDNLFGSDKDEPRKITHHLAHHWWAVGSPSGWWFYRSWAFLLTAGTVIIAIGKIKEWITATATC